MPFETPPPDFAPWHVPHDRFFADTGVIRYPDLQGLADDILARFSAVVDAPAERVLAECHAPRPEPHGYNRSPLSMAVVTWERIRRMAQEAPTWQVTIDDLLAPAPIAP